MEFIRVFLIDHDPDDERLSKIRRKFIRCKCVFDMTDVVGFCEHKEFKKCLMVYFNYTTEEDFIIEHEYNGFKTLYDETRIDFVFDPDDEKSEEIPPEFPKTEKIIEIPKLGKTTNPDEE